MWLSIPLPDRRLLQTKFILPAVCPNMSPGGAATIPPLSSLRDELEVSSAPQSLIFLREATVWVADAARFANSSRETNGLKVV